MSKLRRLRDAFSAPTHRNAARLQARRRPLAELLEERTLLSMTISVNTASDVIDPTFTTISLREAIEISNGTLTYNPATDTSVPKRVSGSQSPPSVGAPPIPNTIVFQIPLDPNTGLPPTINIVGSSLPTITNPVVIQGYTESGASVSPVTETQVIDNTAVVRIDGVGLGTPVGGGSYDGLDITAPNCTISGLIITGFSGYGVSIANPASGFAAQGNWLWGNFIGAVPDTANARVFSNDPVSELYGSPQPAETTQLGNLEGGLRIASSNNLIGGNTPGLPNVIANNGISAVGNDTPAFAATTANAGLGVGILIDNAPSLPVNSPQTGTGNLIEGNAIYHNGSDGVFVRSSNNTIGESISGGGNLISGNLGNGVVITGGPTVQGNRLLGNFIGTELGNKSGSIVKGTISFPFGQGVGNEQNGVLILDSPRNTVGGAVGTDLNVIGPNVLDGVRIMDSAPSLGTASISVGNAILNNDIGFNLVAGEIYFLPNQNGVDITTGGNFVGQAVQGAGNTISNNYGDGILISTPEASGNTIEGNVIGLNPDGGSAFRNSFDGVHIDNAPNNIIGGTSSLARNTISSNNNGVVIVGDPTNNYATGNRILGNFIGTDVGGTIDLGNAVDGVVLDNAPNNDIGDTSSGSGNVISGNNRGIRLIGSATINNRIRGNFIGTDLSGMDLIQNETDGIIITAGASSNLIGGIVTGAANTIVNNIAAGINIDNGVENSILGNEIYNNLGQGLVYPSGSTNLGSGIFLNPATGANDLQAAPTITAVTSTGAYTNVKATFSGLPTHTYRIEFFSTDVADPSGFGQAKTLLDSFEATYDPVSGSYPIDHNLPSLVPPGEYITATATDETTGDTSAFSNAFAVPIAFSLSNATVTSSGATYTANETDGQILIQVTRNAGMTPPSGGVIAVPYTLSGGTAVAGVDYSAASASGTLYFNSTDPDTKTFTIQILNPHKKGGSVTTNIALGSPTGGAELSTPSSAVLTINDNDATPTLQLASATASVDQAAGSIALTISRDTSVGTTTVNYATAAGTATPGTNYTTTTGTVTFNPGQLTQTVNVPILNAHPNQVAPAVNFTFALSNPTNGGIGPIGSTVVTIIDSQTPGTIVMAQPVTVAAPGAKSISVQVARTGGSAGTVTVHYATNGGTAHAGVDYTPISGTLQFAPGETTKTLDIPLSGNTSGPNVNVNLTISSPTGGATLGVLTSSLVAIQHGGTGGGTTPVTPPSGDTVPPTITSFQPIAGPQGVYAIALTFSEAMNPSRATDVSNYGSFLRTTGPDGLFGTHDDGSIQIVSAGYDAVNRRSVLTLATPLPFGSFASIMINGNATLATPKGLTDLAGNYLDGSGAGNAPGTPFSTVFGEGSSLKYIDASGDTVTLKLAGSGLMTLRRSSNGEAQQLQLQGTTHGKSVLSGTVKKPNKRAGSTTIPSITGASGVVIKLRGPAFHIGGMSAAALKVVARLGSLRARR